MQDLSVPSSTVEVVMFPSASSFGGFAQVRTVASVQLLETVSQLQDPPPLCDEPDRAEIDQPTGILRG